MEKEKNAVNYAELIKGIMGSYKAAVTKYAPDFFVEWSRIEMSDFDERIGLRIKVSFFCRAIFKNDYLGIKKRRLLKQANILVDTLKGISELPNSSIDFGNGIRDYCCDEVQVDWVLDLFIESTEISENIMAKERDIQTKLSEVRAKLGGLTEKKRAIEKDLLNSLGLTDIVNSTHHSAFLPM